MKLNDIKSAELLPEFAAEKAYTCEALDEIIKGIDARRPALSQGFTMAAIEAMTDEELQAAYDDLDLAIYYPDLSRRTRNIMLYLEYRIIERLGTPRAVETMVQYCIGEETPIQLQIVDNLAFDQYGDLIDESLLHYFDAIIEIQDVSQVSFDTFFKKRILENILKFDRNTKALRNLALSFEPTRANVHIYQNCTICTVTSTNAALRPVLVGESGWMTDAGNEPFESPRGVFDMSSLELIYGGGEPLFMDEITEKKGYLRSSAYQNANRALAENNEYYLYSEGADSTIDGDALKNYTLTGAFTVAAVPVDITGAALNVSGGKLKLTWGPVGAFVCYITYLEV